MQRLYTMFPKGAPGAALLLVRVALSLSVAQERWQSAAHDPTWALAAVVLIALATGIGLLTPLMCAIVVVVEIATWPVGGPLWQEGHLCIAFYAVALAMLGPGAYSIDNLAFGRRRMVFIAARSRGGDEG